MTSKRTQIRDAVVTLVTGLPLTGANVFGNPPYALVTGQLPALLVRGGEQRPGELGLGDGRAIWRDMDIDIELVVRDSGDWQDVLDAMFEDVIAALFASSDSRTLGGLLCRPMEEGLVSEPDFDLSTDKPVARMAYRQRVVFLA